MITDLPTRRIQYCYHSDKHFSDFLPTRWRQKSADIDMEQNHVTVTVCIAEVKPSQIRLCVLSDFKNAFLCLFS